LDSLSSLFFLSLSPSPICPRSSRSHRRRERRTRSELWSKIPNCLFLFQFLESMLRALNWFWKIDLCWRVIFLLLLGNELILMCFAKIVCYARFGDCRHWWLQWNGCFGWIYLEGEFVGFCEKPLFRVMQKKLWNCENMLIMKRCKWIMKIVDNWIIESECTKWLKMIHVADPKNSG